MTTEGTETPKAAKASKTAETSPAVEEAIETARAYITERHGDPDKWLLAMAPDGTPDELAAAARAAGIAPAIMQVWWRRTSAGLRAATRRKIARQRAAEEAARQAEEEERLRLARAERSEQDKAMRAARRTYRFASLEQQRQVLDMRTNELVGTKRIKDRTGLPILVIDSICGPLTLPTVRYLDAIRAISRLRQDTGRWPRWNVPGERPLAARLAALRTKPQNELVLHVADLEIPGWREVQDYAHQRVRGEERFKQRLDEVAQFVADNGTLPRPGASDESERRLGAWVAAQRSAYRAKPRKLADERVAALDERLPGWSTGAGRTPWQKRVEQLAKFHEKHGRLPRQARPARKTERELALWLTRQRSVEAHATLNSDLVAALDEKVPGWRKSAA